MAEQAVRGRAGGRPDDHAAGRARPRAGPRRRHLGLAVLTSTRSRCRWRRRSPLLVDWTRRLLGSRRRRPRQRPASSQVQENKFYADLAGTRDHPAAGPAGAALRGDGRRRGDRRLRLDAHDRAAGRPRLGVPHRRPAATGTPSCEQIPEPARARSSPRRRVEAGAYDLVIHPSNLWLTIHESIGHATELDRALGYEANYAGTSFATYDKLGTLQYGSPVMNVTGDRTVEHGLATIGYDDEGVRDPVAGTSSSDGVLVGYQLDRPMAHTCSPSSTTAAPTAARSPTPPATSRSSGWPTCRCSPRRDGPATDGADRQGRARHLRRRRQVLVDRHAALQLPVHRPAVLPDRGRQARRPVRDVAYQATTTDFWGSMEAVGGPQTWVLGGAFNCGKAQPGQVAAVSHGCPSALFRGVNILNTTRRQAGRPVDAPSDQRAAGPSSSTRLVDHAATSRRLRRDRARRTPAPTCAGPTTP